MTITQNTKDPIKTANAFNWGIFRNDASAAKVQEQIKRERAHVKRIEDIGVDIDVNALPKAQVEQFETDRVSHLNQSFAAAIMIGEKAPEKLVTLEERKAEYRDKIAAAEAEAKAKAEKAASVAEPDQVISGTMPPNGIRFTQGGKEIPVSDARDLLSPTPVTTDELEGLRDQVFSLLEKQKHLSAQARIGKSLDAQRVISEAGIENQIMPTHTRQLYAEMTETAVAQKDIVRLRALIETFDEIYGEYTRNN